MKLSHLASLFLVVSLAAPASAQLDVYWQSSRISQELHRINSCGEVTLTVNLSTNFYPGTTAPQLRSAHLAPDGKVWVINFIVNHFTILDVSDEKNVKITNIPVKSAGFPYTIVFDKKGQAYISMTGRGTGFDGVEVYDKAGKLVKQYAMKGANPLGMSIDNQQRVWVASRLAAPSRVTMIDPAGNNGKGTIKVYNFPASSGTLGGQVVAGYTGLTATTPSPIFCIGDRTSELVWFAWDATKKDYVAQKIYTIDPNSTTISAMTIDKNNNLWIGNFRTPDVYYFETSGKNLGKVTRTLQSPPNCLGLAMDSRGRLLATARVSFSGPAKSVVRRWNVDTFNIEQESTVGIGAGAPADSQFHSALVGDPLGDADGDKKANFLEITRDNTSAFDPQSNNDLSILISGTNAQGGAIEVNVTGRGTSATLAAGLAKLPAPVAIGGWSGNLLINPSSILGLSSVMLPAKVKATVPKLPVLVGLKLYYQAVSDVAGTVYASNLDCVAIYK